MAHQPSLEEAPASVREVDPNAAPPGYELLVERRPPGLVRRYFQTQQHVLGLIFGGIRSWGLEHRDTVPKPRGYGLARMTGALTGPFLDTQLREMRFPVQLRRRLEILGPTYIKLGQVLSLRTMNTSAWRSRKKCSLSASARNWRLLVVRSIHSVTAGPYLRQKRLR